MIHTNQINTPLGKAFLVLEDNELIGLFYNTVKFAKYISRFKEINENAEHPLLKEIDNWLSGYFNGMNISINFSIKTYGTEFQQKIWQMLLEVPYGETVTYKYLADRYAKENGMERMSAQAVGGAVGSNPISIIIPCHRIIGTSGSLTGYAGGLDMKEFLLSLESKNK